MFVHEIHDLSNIYVTDLLKNGLSEITDPEVAKNYSYSCSTESSNLFRVLERGRYAPGKGTYYVVEDNGKYVSSAGWNEYSSDTALLMTRMYVSEACRSKYFMGELLLPHMFEATQKYPFVWMTFNEKNKALYNWISRSYGSSKNIWPKIWFNFEAIGIRNVYNVDQYVVQMKK